MCRIMAVLLMYRKNDIWQELLRGAEMSRFCFLPEGRRVLAKYHLRDGMGWSRI